VNGAIRAELLRTGRLGAETTVTSFQPVDATVAQRRDPAFYQAGQHAHFVQRYGRFAKGDVCAIVGANAKGVVLEKEGRQSTMSFRYAERIAVVAPTPLAVAPGDRLQLKFNGRALEGQPLANGELVTVRAVHADGRLAVADENGAVKTLSARQRVFNLGYAITSYGSQGKTVDTVLLADAGSRAATNCNQWYVAISRARKRAFVFTPDKAALRQAIARDGGRPLAVELKGAPQAAVAPSRSPAWLRQVRRAIASWQGARFLDRVRNQVRSVHRHL
jgi:hypothetical protein